MEAASEPSEEELNPYSIFPQPEHNLRVIYTLSDNFVYEGSLPHLYVLSSLIVVRTGCIISDD